jgi:hypothetical protein
VARLGGTGTAYRIMWTHRTLPLAGCVARTCEATTAYRNSLQTSSGDRERDAKIPILSMGVCGKTEEWVRVLNIVSSGGLRY